MINVNLTRLHSMIKTSSTEMNGLLEKLSGARVRFAFNIFETTTKSDLDEFRQKILKQKRKIAEGMGKCEKLLAYGAYLKKILNECNDKFGIADRLLEASRIERTMRLLNSFREILKAGYDDGGAPIKGVDYYKTAFTEQNRVFDLGLFMFDEGDLNSLERREEKLRNRQIEVNNEIATLNQMSIAEIFTFDEFGEQDFEPVNSGSKP